MARSRGWFVEPDCAARRALDPRRIHAARYVIARVRSQVPADLVQASLFGSRARGDARPDSDVDLLLIFRRLPDDREPHASHAEWIASAEAARHRVPVTVWSVSLIDLALGNRTPMLVDALADAIPLWCRDGALPPIEFTARDALGCVAALLQRVDEGSLEVAARLARRDADGAARRIRDDIVRLCTAALLLAGVTRPRRGEAVRAFIDRERPPPAVERILEWAERSFGFGGREEEARVSSPAAGLASAARVAETLRRGVARRAGRLRAADDPGKALENRTADRNVPCAPDSERGSA